MRIQRNLMLAAVVTFWVSTSMAQQRMSLDGYYNHLQRELTLRTNKQASEAKKATRLDELERHADQFGKKATEVLGSPVAGISADRILKLYKSNGVAADKSLKGRVICVCGIVREISKSSATEACKVLIEPLDDELYPRQVICLFESGFEDQLSDFRAGEPIQVMGVCGGSSEGGYDVTIKGCGPYFKEYQKKLAKWLEKQGEEAARIAAEKKRLRREAVAKEADEKRKKRPLVADGLLKTAKNFKASGKAEAYEKWLKRIVDQYPETAAAKEAKRLLADIR